MLQSLDKKDPMKIWQEMKENGFLTPSLAIITTSTPTPKPKPKPKPKPEPKPPTKQRGIGVQKRKMKKQEEEKKKLDKIAAPSGLLNELNPGIINRIRNSQQVFSVIQSLLKSVEIENLNHKNKNVDFVEKRFSPENENENEFPVSSQVSNCSSTTLSGVQFTGLEDEGVEKPISFKIQHASNCFSNEKPVNAEICGSSLPEEGTALASQWLQFLHQDISRRITALRCSRPRVQDSIQIELSFLMLKELALNQQTLQLSAAGCPISMTMDKHQVKWKIVFDQIDRALNEEANHLELWLNQVIEMQLCSKTFPLY